MLRLSHYLHTLLHPAPLASARPPAGPVVIWNLIRRCNLTCQHCYSTSADKDFDGELSTDEVFTVLDDLYAFGVRVLILSGGEPLLRPDIFTIGRRARDMGFYVGLSSNGTLIDAANVGRIADTGFDYVGVSLDGIGATHDRFRRMDGGFARALDGICLARDVGIKVGVRYTMTEDNAHDLPALLQLVADEGIDKFYFSHLNYAGRGNKHRDSDARHARTRWAMDLLLDACHAHLRAGDPRDFVTGNNDADGIYLLQWAARHYPAEAPALQQRLLQWGGNASGVNVANIDNVGNVHPDTMWWQVTLGNVRERPFSAIWPDTSHPLMAGLKQRPRPVTGRCAACAHLAICNGNTRVRAWQLTGDYWAADPACYLTDAEIGVTPGSYTLPALTPWRRGSIREVQA
ncbi:heme d1 biosynthesis radical SAM protein NirJ [Vogesella sp. LIG4]|uniref:heme d1 biosynthesis radical SAM protein NirJ n=1 Tax=Vogesella sp. LIG4 TaxID=1192162 RepID=UPI00081F94BE|nr:heme d1 biosynthesis radical SAM protein NirJ [Vogesella sp. LIG4]SCK19389.1 heme d1 biosynthesis radical SAM protein NirJ [Vogesella sp. LIG4]